MQKKRINKLKVEIDIIEVKGISIAVLRSFGVAINETQDALDLMANAGYMNSHKIIINEDQIVPGFFDLKTGIAGEILQKFSTYNIQLAIAGDFQPARLAGRLLAVGLCS